MKLKTSKELNILLSNRECFSGFLQRDLMLEVGRTREKLVNRLNLGITPNTNPLESLFPCNVSRTG